jgi:hypothetical protein
MLGSATHTGHPHIALHAHTATAQDPYSLSALTYSLTSASRAGSSGSIGDARLPRLHRWVRAPCANGSWLSR